MAEPAEPTITLVAAQTEGLKLRSRDGDILGTVKAFMVDKRTGRASYAVLSWAASSD